MSKTKTIMISTLDRGVERGFILDVAGDLATYVVIDGSLKYCFEGITQREMVDQLLNRRRVILSDEFNDLLGEEELIRESHMLKRAASHRNAIEDLPYHLGKAGRGKRQRNLIDEHEGVIRIIKNMRRLNTLSRFAEKERINYEGLKLFDVAAEFSRKYPLTLMTSDQGVVQDYVMLQRKPDLSDMKRFEVALVHPGEQAFSYLYPELVRSKRFDDFCRTSEVA